MLPTIHTIGHSNLSFMRFLTHLQGNNISHVIDIRSIPYSRHAPWSNKSRLSEILKPFNIRYTYFGHKLGGKKPSQDKFAAADTADSIKFYDEAIQTLLHLTEKEHLALLCAEGDPANCHRQHVIAQSLLNSGVSVTHILKDGSLMEAWREDALPEQPELF
jgi:uncharacterized protein (DUF488 family)